MRRVADINEMIDIMSSIKGGTFATVCYMSSAKVGKTLTGKNVNVDQFGSDLDANRIEGDDEVYNTLKDYQQGGASRNNKFPYGGIVKMTRYQFNWQTEDKYNQNFSKYADSRDQLLSKYGAAIERREGYDKKQDFGNGGVSVGATDNTQGKLYTHQNGATARNVKAEYYVVDQEGNLKGGISPKAIKQIVAKSGDADGVSALRKIGATEEQIKEYTEELKKLNFSVLKMMYDCILFIVTSVNGEKICFINNKLANTVGSGSYAVTINPKSFIDKANELFKASCTELTEAIKRYLQLISESKKVNKMNKKVTRINESTIRKMIEERAKAILSELDWRTYASAAKKGDKWRKEHPAHRANKWNRVYGFDNAAMDSFSKQHGLEHQYDNGAYGGDKGSMGIHSHNGEVEFSGSRDHDFGDGGGVFNLNHNVYHMGKKYGKDGNYGRTRMWDRAHETTPEEFYGDEEMGKKFRAADQEVDDFNSGKSHYVKGKGWTNESKLNEWGNIESDLDADEIYGDKAEREDRFNRRMQMMQDDYEYRMKKLMQKYPNKSREWYEAMIDTFYESKKGRKTINEIGDTSNGQYAMGKLAARQQYRDKNSKGAFETSWKAGDQQPNDRKGDNMNRAFHQGKADGQKQFMKEESFQNNQGYSHFAVNKATNKIVNGWDYSEYDPSELRQFKKDYFNVDLEEYGFDPKQYKIVTAKFLMRQGIDPNDNNNWANS